EADRAVGRPESAETGDAADPDDRDQQDSAATDPVAHAAEDETADRAGGQPHSEGGEGGQRRGGGVLVREVLNIEDERGGGTEEEEVVPFECGADQRPDGHLVRVLDAEFLGGTELGCGGGGSFAHCCLRRGLGTR